MCVITFAKDVRPTDEQVQKMFDTNRDGAGIAWFEGDELVWKKGIFDVKEIQRLCKEVPLPYVSHFRIGTVGGTLDTLTHPFVIDERASTTVEGRTKTARLLFHNGHWSPWNDKVIDAAIHSNQEIPQGDWSDTRAMAWMCHIYGQKVLDMLVTQRIVVMNPTLDPKKRIEIYTGDGWKKVNTDGGVIWCSNESWNYTSYNHSQRRDNKDTFRDSAYYCVKGMCKNRRQIGKELCEECEKKSASDSEDHSRANSGGSLIKSPSALEIVTGGSPRPFAGCFSLREVEELYIRGECTKTKRKKFVKQFGRVGKGGRKEIRALVEIARLSKDLACLIMEDRRKTVAGSKG